MQSRPRTYGHPSVGVATMKRNNCPASVGFGPRGYEDQGDLRTALVKYSGGRVSGTVPVPCRRWAVPSLPNLMSPRVPPMAGRWATTAHTESLRTRG
jgi:hypothetical protein